MAQLNADRVKETSATTGTSTMVLAGAAAGFQTFVAGIGDGNTTTYCITDGTDWEVGFGTITAGGSDTLSRDTVYASSNSGSKVNFGAGTKDVFCCQPADGAPVWDGAGAQFQNVLGFASSTLTLASGAATGTKSRHVVAAESGTEDTFDTLTATNYKAGDVVYLVADSGDTIYVSAAGNFVHPCLLSQNWWTPFMYTGSAWEILLNGHVLLDKKNASASSSLDFTFGIGSVYDKYVFVLSRIVPATDGASLRLRGSTNGGSSYLSTNEYSFHNPGGADGSSSYAGVVGSGTTSIQVGAGAVSSDAGDALSGSINLYTPSDTAVQKMVTGDTVTINDAGAIISGFVGGCILTTSAVNAIRFLMSTGNITSGSIALYGLRAST